MEQTKRIRLNQEYRNKIAKRIELGLDQEHTIEKEKYLQLREQIKPLQDKTWNLMYAIGRENYPQEDVDMAWHLQKKIRQCQHHSTRQLFSCCIHGHKKRGQT